MATNNEKARNAAVQWAINIAKDNTFHYGEDKWAHHNGCYFCGTNGKNSAKVKAGAKYEDQLKTYCCNPFVTAAYNHGAGVPGIDCKVASKRINLANATNKPLQDTKEWKKITKPSKVTSLLPGDILLTPTHAMLYVGNGQIAHAAGHDNGPSDKTKWNNSIRVEKCPDKKWTATTKIYRYIGNGKFGGANMFEVGKIYTLQDDMNIRSGAGSDNALVPVEKWTTGAKAQATADGMLAKGTRVTCKDSTTLSSGAVWMQIPSGWICAIGSTGKVFVAEEAVIETPKVEPVPEVKEEAPIVEEVIESTVEEPEIEENIIPEIKEEENVVKDFEEPSKGLFNLAELTDKNSVIRMIVSALTSINLIVVAFGGQAITISDNVLYLIASVIAFVVTVGIAIYKNNATSKFGMLCKKIKTYVKKYGVEQIYVVVMDALYANFSEPSDEDPRDDEVLPQ